MTKKVLKTKDRKHIIRTLKTKLKIVEKFAKDCIIKLQTLEDRNARMHRFIKAYNTYLSAYGRKEDKLEYKRLMKSFMEDDTKWL